MPVFDIRLSYTDMTTTLAWQQTAPHDAFHIARSWKTPTTSTPPHTHDFAEVFWIDTGKGRQTGPTGVQPLRTGDIIFIRPTDIHALESAGRMQLTNVAFPADTYRWIRDRYPTPWTDAPTPAVLQLDSAQLHRLSRAAEELFNAPRTRLFIERFLLNLLHLLTPPPQPALPVESPPWFRQACFEIVKPEHFRTGTLEFAKLAGRTPEHVARVTRELLHETPSTVVNRARMQYAARQLAMTDTMIMDIALDCGLTNLSHFYRLFRQQYGMTPKAYRNQQRGLA